VVSTGRRGSSIKEKQEINVSDSTPAPNQQDLPALGEAIRRHIEAAQRAGVTALHHTLAAGDALIEAQSRVSTNWKDWLRANCFLSVRTALLYQQLARHRAEIEAEMSRVSDLTLRAARRFITKPKATATVEKPKKDGNKPPALNPASFMDASPFARTRFFDDIGLPAIRKALSPKLNAELDRRVNGQPGAGRSALEAAITQALRKALSLQLGPGAKIAGPETANILNGILRRLERAGVGLCDIDITIRAAKLKRAA
jgi:hypothetical protein